MREEYGSLMIIASSTFINRIIKQVSGEQDVITTSHFPGTTLDMIQIPLGDDEYLIDTPGIINHHQMAHYVNKGDLKIITPKKEIKPRTCLDRMGKFLQTPIPVRPTLHILPTGRTGGGKPMSAS